MFGGNTAAFILDVFKTTQKESPLSGFGDSGSGIEEPKQEAKEDDKKEKETMH